MKNPPSKKVYILFWLTSSGQSNEEIIRVYKSKPSLSILKDDLNDWVENLACWKVGSDKHYGWKLISNNKIPKNRKHCLEIYGKACKIANKAKQKQRLYAMLLGIKPFSG